MENKKNYCKTCEEYFSSVSTYNRHLKSKSHLKRLWYDEQDNPDREEKFNLTEKEFLKLESGEKYKLETKENLYVCEYCDYETNDSGNFTRHKLTEKHILNEAKVKAGLSREKTAETLEDLKKIKEKLNNDLKVMKIKEEKEIKFIDDNSDNPLILMDKYNKKLNITQQTIENIREDILKIDFKIENFEGGSIIKLTSKKEELSTEFNKLKKKLETEQKFIKDNKNDGEKLIEVDKIKKRIIGTQARLNFFEEELLKINKKIDNFKEKSGEIITVKEQKKRIEKGGKNKKILIEEIKNDEEDLKIKEAEFEENATGFKNFKKSMKKKGVVIDKEGLKKASKFQAESNELKEKLKNPLKYELNNDDIELYRETIEKNKIELEKIAEENNITIKILFQFTNLINDLEANINDIEELKENLKENNEKYKKLFES